MSTSILSTASLQMDKKQFQKMVFLANAIEQGWSVKKRDDCYVFTKKHDSRREVFQADYLEKFIQKNAGLETVSI